MGFPDFDQTDNFSELQALSFRPCYSLTGSHFETSSLAWKFSPFLYADIPHFGILYRYCIFFKEIDDLCQFCIEQVRGLEFLFLFLPSTP